MLQEGSKLSQALRIIGAIIIIWFVVEVVLHIRAEIENGEPNAVDIEDQCRTVHMGSSCSYSELLELAECNKWKGIPCSYADWIQYQSM